MDVLRITPYTFVIYFPYPIFHYHIIGPARLSQILSDCCIRNFVSPTQLPFNRLFNLQVS